MADADGDAGTWKPQHARSREATGVSPADVRPRHRPDGVPRQTPLERAQQLIYKAFAFDDPDAQITLAQKALKLSRDCADAYTILAEYAPDGPQALMLCAEGVAAAERTIGPELSQLEPGTF